MSTISIIGCGWLGLPLSTFLIQEGYIVKGSTTSKEKLSKLEHSGINPFLIQLSGSKVMGDISRFLKDSEALIVNIPPGLRRDPYKDHVKEMQHLITAVNASSIKHIIYISSTSVFKDEVHYPIIYHDTFPNATSKAAQQLKKIESLWQNVKHKKVTILRFGGLIDSHRHPGKMLSGRSNLKNGNAPVNLIHKNDCIAIIKIILDKNVWNTTLNAVYPLYIDKKTYYTTYCKSNKLALPHFDPYTPALGKIIDSRTIIKQLNYTFQYSIL